MTQHETERDGTEVLTPAQKFIDKFGQRIEDALETMIGEAYLKQLEGTPATKSQYGVEYETNLVVADVKLDEAAALQFLIDTTAIWVKEHPGKAIVWRIRPVLSSGIFDDWQAAVPKLDPGKVKLRFRAHVLQEIPECLP